MKYLPIFLALMILMGVSTAIDSVNILSPVEGQKFKLGEQISIRAQYVDLDGNSNMFSQMFVNGVQSSSRFTPTERGFYTIEIVVTDSYDGSIVSDSVTIQVNGNSK